MRINSKRLGVVASALAFGLGVALTASSARADLGLEDEYTVILIDASGSMRDQAAGYSTPWSKWKEAISRAKEFVNQQRLGTLGYSTDTGWDPENATVSPPGSRGTYAKYNQCYQIWQFGNKEFTKIYPTDGGNASGFQCMDQTDDTARTVSYAKVTNALGSMVEPADEFVMTPLAQGLCRALHELYHAPSDELARRSLLLETDGMENWSDATTACWGPDSVAPFNPAAVNPQYPSYLAWAGGTDEDSWQWRVYTAAILNPAYNGDLTEEYDRTGLDGITIPDLGSDPKVFGIKPEWSWNDFYSQGLGMPSGDMLKYWSRKVIMHVDALYKFIESETQSAYVAEPELDKLKVYMRGMSEISGGRFQKIQYHKDMRFRPGVYREFPGDLRNRGYVDIVDVQQIMQKDVFGRPTSDGGELVIKADVNRDGWVNMADANIAMKNKGCGRINGVYKPCKVPTID